MNRWESELYGDQRASERSVDVADDENRVRLNVKANALERLHRLRRRDRVRPAADAQIHVRKRNFEFAEKKPRHFFVVMLPGVNKNRLELRTLFENAH